MRQHHNPNEPITYQIQVQGQLDEGWADWLATMTMTYDGHVTTLAGPVADQAALRGMLCQLWDLNLTLVSVHRVETENEEKQEND